MNFKMISKVCKIIDFNLSKRDEILIKWLAWLINYHQKLFYLFEKLLISIQFKKNLF
jgi:hypothetical protein